MQGVHLAHRLRGARPAAAGGEEDVQRCGGFAQAEVWKSHWKKCEQPPFLSHLCLEGTSRLFLSLVLFRAYIEKPEWFECQPCDVKVDKQKSQRLEKGREGWKSQKPRAPLKHLIMGPESHSSTYIYISKFPLLQGKNDLHIFDPLWTCCCYRHCFSFLPIPKTRPFSNTKLHEMLPEALPRCPKQLLLFTSLSRLWVRML